MTLILGKGGMGRREGMGSGMGWGGESLMAIVMESREGV